MSPRYGATSTTAPRQGVGVRDESGSADPTKQNFGSCVIGHPLPIEVWSSPALRQAPRLGKQRHAAAFVVKRQRRRESHRPPFLARPQRVESLDPVCSTRFGLGRMSHGSITLPFQSAITKFTLICDHRGLAIGSSQAICSINQTQTSSDGRYHTN